MYTIYKATNKQNGKSYIGFDSKWPSRQSKHKRISKNPRYHFHKAIQKYGWESFDWEIIFQGWNLSFVKDFAETYFIHEYSTYDKGYNSTRGGEGGTGYKHTPEAKEKIRIAQSTNNSMAGRDAWNKGIPCREGTKQKISKANKGHVSPNKGKPMSSEQKQKLSAYYKGLPKSEKWKESRRGHIPWNKGKKLA